MSTDLRSWVIVFVKGFCMGSADAVPGVSGGTVALITGIYERLIGAITAIDGDNVRRLLRGLRPGRWGTIVTTLSEMDLFFLVVLGLGIASAVVAITSLVERAVSVYPVPTFGFFFGLIAASALVLVGHVSLETTNRKVAAVLGFLLAFVLSGQASGMLPTGNLLVVFVAGAIAVSAMILPGISGSLLLLILGQYVYMSTALSKFKDAVLGVVVGNGTDALVRTGVPVVTFIAGALVGLFTISHVVDWALKHYREATMAFLVALIVGALRAPIVKAGDGISGGWTASAVAIFLGLAVVGAALVYLIDRYAADIEYDEEVDDSEAV